LVALTVVLLMAPTAYHRIVYAGEDVQDMYRVGSALVTAATAPLALGLAGDVYVVVTKIAASPAAGLAAGSLALVSLIGLWYAYRCSRRLSGPAPSHKANSPNARSRTTNPTTCHAPLKPRGATCVGPLTGVSMMRALQMPPSSARRRCRTIILLD
jgi:hypothetical protein